MASKRTKPATLPPVHSPPSRSFIRPWCKLASPRKLKVSRHEQPTHHITAIVSFQELAPSFPNHVRIECIPRSLPPTNIVTQPLQACPSHLQPPIYHTYPTGGGTTAVRPSIILTRLTIPKKKYYTSAFAQLNSCSGSKNPFLAICQPSPLEGTPTVADATAGPSSTAISTGA